MYNPGHALLAHLVLVVEQPSHWTSPQKARNATLLPCLTGWPSVELLASVGVKKTNEWNIWLWVPVFPLYINHVSSGRFMRSADQSVHVPFSTSCHSPSVGGMDCWMYARGLLTIWIVWNTPGHPLILVPLKLLSSFLHLLPNFLQVGFRGDSLLISTCSEVSVWRR